MSELTRSQSEALKWLSERGGDAAFTKDGVALAMGETAPHTRTTWNALAVAKRVRFYNPSPRGRGRMCITEAKP
jgi:hypothetical protein